MPLPAIPVRSKQLVRSAAVALALGVSIFWFSKGAHTGWSMNKVPTEMTDEITGINYTEYEDRFVPGVEYPATAAIIALGLIVGTFLLPTKPSTLPA